MRIRIREATQAHGSRRKRSGDPGPARHGGGSVQGRRLGARLPLSRPRRTRRPSPGQLAGQVGGGPLRVIGPGRGLGPRCAARWAHTPCRGPVRRRPASRCQRRSGTVAPYRVGGNANETMTTCGRCRTWRTVTPARRKRSPTARALHGIAWIVTAMLLVVAVLRIVAWDDLLLLAVLNAFQLFLYLPAWVIAAAAGGLPAVVARSHLAGGGGRPAVLRPARVHRGHPGPRRRPGAETLRLFDANVSQDNRSMAGYVAQIRRLHPDLVTMEEFARPPTWISSRMPVRCAPCRTCMRRPPMARGGS